MEDFKPSPPGWFMTLDEVTTPVAGWVQEDPEEYLRPAKTYPVGWIGNELVELAGELHTERKTIVATEDGIRLVEVTTQEDTNEKLEILRKAFWAEHPIKREL